MTDPEEIYVKERVLALHEARGMTATARSLGLYWAALRDVAIEDFDAAVLKAAKIGMFKPHELLSLAREAQRERLQPKGVTVGQYRCNAHMTEPSAPSEGEYCWWCDRCVHFTSGVPISAVKA